ncbi:MAG TPA: aromatic-ring-hydroxylating dioxygenase subunit beta [Candidatus Binataceae bacterium]|nr:aromatic-ring-hydroxylating dioxygenase subunit beta [Candidatus Binataceae bacterium]
MSGDVAIDSVLQFEIERLQARYVTCIDDDRLEEWPAFFTEQCRYQIISAENYTRKLPVGVFFADSRAMLSDRVAALRQANIYEAQRYRHLVGATLISARHGEIVTAQSNYQVVRVLQDGSTMIFSVGRYLDRINLNRGAPLFEEKLVVFDNRRIDTLLAIPI